MGLHIDTDTDINIDNQYTDYVQINKQNIVSAILC